MRVSRLHRSASPPPRSWHVAFWALVAVNVAFLALALTRGGEEVRDGAAGVTSGFIVAGGIAGTFLVAWLVGVVPLTRRIALTSRILVLGAQALHAGGHLFRIYYLFPWYDDALHAGLVLLLGLVILAAARSRRFLFTWDLGPLRVALLVWTGAVAAAGVWEIFEFVADVALGTREQDNLYDTMVDMMDGMFGATVAALFSWRAVRAEERGKALGDAHSEELLD